MLSSLSLQFLSFTGNEKESWNQQTGEEKKLLRTKHTNFQNTTTTSQIHRILLTILIVILQQNRIKIKRKCKSHQKNFFFSETRMAKGISNPTTNRC